MNPTTLALLAECGSAVPIAFLSPNSCISGNDLHDNHAGIPVGVRNECIMGVKRDYRAGDSLLISIADTGYYCDIYCCFLLLGFDPLTRVVRYVHPS